MVTDSVVGEAMPKLVLELVCKIQFAVHYSSVHAGAEHEGYCSVSGIVVSGRSMNKTQLRLSSFSYHLLSIWEKPGFADESSS